MASSPSHISTPGVISSFDAISNTPFIFTSSTPITRSPSLTCLPSIATTNLSPSSLPIDSFSSISASPPLSISSRSPQSPDFYQQKRRKRVLSSSSSQWEDEGEEDQRCAVEEHEEQMWSCGFAEKEQEALWTGEEDFDLTVLTALEEQSCLGIPKPGVSHGTWNRAHNWDNAADSETDLDSDPGSLKDFVVSDESENEDEESDEDICEEDTCNEDDDDDDDEEGRYEQTGVSVKPFPSLQRDLKSGMQQTLRIRFERIVWSFLVAVGDGAFLPRLYGLAEQGDSDLGEAKTINRAQNGGACVAASDCDGNGDVAHNDGDKTEVVRDREMRSRKEDETRAALDYMDRVVIGSRLQQLRATSRWRDRYRERVDCYPHLVITSSRVAPSDECQACQLPRVSRFLISLSGQQRHDLTLKLDPFLAADKQEFVVGRVCKERTWIYHALKHYKATLFVACQEESSSSTAADEKLHKLRQSGWLDRQFKWLQCLLHRADFFQQKRFDSSSAGQGGGVGW
uniref:coiled-coil domain-containing protein 82-like isoform X1 n=1 Tax=Myxine glutinosa TaxID=7769 RepID=UPI00358E237A